MAGFRHGNLFYNVASDSAGEPLVRMAQWPPHHQPVLNGYASIAGSQSCWSH